MKDRKNNINVETGKPKKRKSRGGQSLNSPRSGIVNHNRVKNPFIKVRKKGKLNVTRSKRSRVR